VHPQIGVQFNNFFGLYLAPRVERIFGKPGQNCLGASVLVEVTFGGLNGPISVGIGPDAGWYGDDKAGLAPHAPAYRPSGLYGGRLRFGWHPIRGMKSSDGGVYGRLAGHFDVRLLGGRTAFVGTPDSRNVFVVLPMVTFGLETH
jgi:hypothetical protein